MSVLVEDKTVNAKLLALDKKVSALSAEIHSLKKRLHVIERGRGTVASNTLTFGPRDQDDDEDVQCRVS